MSIPSSSTSRVRPIGGHLIWLAAVLGLACTGVVTGDVGGGGEADALRHSRAPNGRLEAYPT